MSGATTPDDIPVLCLSRRGGEICTRRQGHPGLHHRVGTGLLWSEHAADPPRCPGSGRRADPAPILADGFPGGRALCAVCWGFFPLQHGTLAGHDSWRGDAQREETGRRREWFNTHGW